VRLVAEVVLQVILYLFINVYSHDLFKRSDENLFFEFPISIADAALGTTIEIPTIDGGKAKDKNS
jgi:molecular chaperone DnaJ